TIPSIQGKFNIYKNEMWSTDITFHRNDGSGIQETITQTYGQPFNFPDWENQNWIVNEGDFDFNDVVRKVPYNDLYLLDTSDKEITFDSNGGTIFDVYNAPYNSFFDPSISHEPERDGYVFGGWYIDEELSVLYDKNEPVNSSFTLYAKWLYTLTFVFNDNENGNLEYNIDSDEKIPYPNFDDDKYIWVGFKPVGWYIDEELSIEFNEVYLQENATIYLKWEEISHRVTLKPGENGQINVTKKNNSADVIEEGGDRIVVIPHNGKIKDYYNITVNPKSDYKHVGWDNDIDMAIKIPRMFTATYEKDDSPFIYSEDENGELHFEHDPILLNLLKSLEGTSHGTLRLLQDQSGLYYIQIIEEGSSITMLNNSQLYAVDYLDDGTVLDLFFDIAGNPHTIREKVRPVSFVDDEGNSYLYEILEKDGIVAISNNGSAFGTSHLTATFNRPNDNRYAKLMFSVQDSGSSQQILEKLLNSINAQQNLWIFDQAIMNNSVNQVLIKNIASAFEVKVQIWNGTEWITQGSVVRSTYMMESFLVELDLKDINTQTLQVRFVSPTAVEYRYDDVSIDFTENLPMIIQEMNLVSAILNGETNVLDILSSISDEYVELGYKEGVRLGFEAPELEFGYSRSYGVNMTGYKYAQGSTITDPLLEQMEDKTFEEIKHIIIDSGRQELIDDIPIVEEFYNTIMYIGSQDYETLLELLFSSLNPPGEDD
ncbi:MAG: InlB B-repeat-containing protein, partial [Bacilli bacterium]